MPYNAGQFEGWVRFGPFKVNPATGELWKQGEKIHLQEKSFQVLALLLEHPGELVARGDLHDRLWPGHTFVDFDDSLNAAMRKLRQVLGDAARAPAYIETLPKRGYRFIGEVIRQPHEDAHSLQEILVKKPRGRLRIASILALVGLGGFMTLRGMFYPSPTRPRAPALEPIRSIAVLPFRDLGGVPGQEYFSEGLTGELISELAKFQSLKVIPGGAAMPNRGKGQSIPEIAERLGVGAVLDGAVFRSEGKVRVVVHLMRPDGELMWGGSYDGEMRGVLDLQGRISRGVAKEIHLKLDPRDLAGLGTPSPVNPEAYEAYLKGQYFWAKCSREGLEQGANHFGRAVKLDPSFAPAYCGLGNCFLQMGIYGFMPPRDAAAKARRALEKALALDASQPEAHYSLATEKAWLEWDWAGAEKEFAKGLQLGPSDATGHMHHSIFLMALGKIPASVREAELALSLDPLSLICNTNRARAAYFARDFNTAEIHMKKAIELDPHFAIGHFWLGSTYGQTGRPREAVQEFARFMDEGPEFEAAVLEAFDHEGLQHSLRLLSDRHLQRREAGTPLPALDLARFAAMQGDHETTLKWLQIGFRQRLAEMALIRVEPQWDFIRKEPRFIALVDKMAWPETAMDAGSDP